MPLTICRRPRSPNWVMRGTVRGIRIEESTGVSNKRLAEEIRARREVELLAQSIHGRNATATFAAAALNYLESGRNRKYTEKVISYFKTKPLSEIDSDAITKGALFTYPNAKPATRDRQFFAPASAILRHAAQKGWCSVPVIERPKYNNERIRWITIEEADRLVEACSEHLRPLVIFLLYTGARCGEALWLDWRDVELARAHVSFPKTKNGEARGVGLHPRVVAALANLPHREGEVFRRPDGDAYTKPTRSDDTSAGSRISTAFKGACRRAGIVDFHPHDCRHTWASWHYAENRDFAALKKLGGWKSDKMVLRYTHVNVSELQHTINRLPGGKFGDSKNKHRKKVEGSKR